MKLNKMNQSTAAKVLTITSVIFLAICIAGTILVTTLNDELDVLHANQYDLYHSAEEYRNTVDNLARDARAYAVTGEQQYYDSYITEINTTKTRERTIETINIIGLSDTEQAIFDELIVVEENLVIIEEDAFSLVKNGDLNSASAILYGHEYQNLLSEVSSALDQFEAEFEKRTQDEIDSLGEFESFSTLITFVLLGLTLVTQIVLMQFILRSLVSPLIKIKNKMEEFCQGNMRSPFELEENDTETGKTARAVREFQDFQIRVIDDINYLLSEMADGNFVLRTKCEAEYKGDYAPVLESLRKINRKLSSTLSEINVAANQVDSGANQVSSASASLSQGATEQASSIQELSATINIISDMINANATDANEASAQTNTAGSEIHEANTKMDELVQAMAEISASSDETKKIIKTIEDIAFQTNILALNAAVEAARAGDAGKGFAVVADEVRNLAGKSAEAAKNTTDLIESTVSAIDRGNALVNDVAERMEHVASAAGKIAVINGKIANDSKEAANAIAQVTTGVEQISSVVQNNSATAEETAAASEELSAQSIACRDLVNQFILRDDQE